MAKGAKEQEDLLNTQAGAQLGNANSLYGSLINRTNAIMANPGFTPAQVNTQMNAAETPIAGQVRASQTALRNRAATSHNTAGLVSGQDQLARTGAQLGSQAAYGVQSGADKTALEDRNNALGVQSSLYAPTLGSANSLYGNATEAMKQRDTFGTVFGQILNPIANLWKAAGSTSQG